MLTLSPETQRRAGGAVAAITLQALIAWALITGLSVRIAPSVESVLAVFNIAVPVVVQPKRPKPPLAKRRPSGASAPPHVRAKPTPVIAPVPKIRLPPPPPLIIAAPVVAFESDTAAGASDRLGPGSGAGGEGNGLGSGNGGPGTGGGRGTRAEWVRGELSGRDYPRAARDAGVEGGLTTRVTVDTSGRVADCVVTVSSGSALLDETTCRLIRQRYRYAPARDASGRPATDIVDDDHHWGITRDPER